MGDEVRIRKVKKKRTNERLASLDDGELCVSEGKRKESNSLHTGGFFLLTRLKEEEEEEEEEDNRQQHSFCVSLIRVEEEREEGELR